MIDDKSKPKSSPFEAARDAARDDVSLTLRISRELRDVLYDEAKVEHRSLNSYITTRLEECLGAKGAWPPKSPQTKKQYSFMKKDKPK